MVATKEPAIVAELGRPETPDETAERKAETSRKHRAGQTTFNLVVALIELDQPCLVETEVRHAAEPILLLAHEDRERLAAARVDIEYDAARTDPQRIAALLSAGGYACGAAEQTADPPTDKPAWLTAGVRVTTTNAVDLAMSGDHRQY